ncbi:hypothetical protein C8D77_11398 [Mesorhizobium loti]|jgi:hypothetical protein|uniref:Uncharacterized protein n=1 Tax=Rhizobium loti TaxID=381 RepID=A0A8E2W9W2_RHILI|nr:MULTISPECIES: hypothetical protein [Mesorhizobium]PWJ88009.1 hypothetical protein C8D77_11398 [Mesorhizobium loti]
MQDLIDFFQTNSVLVVANPTVFATCAVLFASGGFVVGRYFLTERLANLESRIARRDEEIKELKSLGSAKHSEPPLIPIIGTSAIGAYECREVSWCEACGRNPNDDSGVSSGKTAASFAGLAWHGSKTGR